MAYSKITPSCQYGLTDTVWRGSAVSATAAVSKQRNIFGGKATIYSIAFATDDNTSTFDYIKLYDAVSAKDGSGNLVAPTLIIPTASTCKSCMTFPQGLPFTEGVTVRATSDIADSGTTAPAGNIFVTIVAR